MSLFIKAVQSETRPMKNVNISTDNLGFVKKNALQAIIPGATGLKYKMFDCVWNK